ncbi:hypothetical protein AB0J63_29035 [Streptosporangium canum]|uniref:hypothetical protein n=1 Tax=Streptosporangium canum TaxID=324952 RepID=UPI00343039C3
MIVSFIQELHARGVSHAQIAEQAGLPRGRIHQIKHTGPAPEDAFPGTGTITPATPLKREAGNARPVVAMGDVTAAKRVEDLARPDRNGNVLVFTGIHPQGALGAVDLLTSEIAPVWGQVGENRFPAVVGVEYDPAIGEPVRAEPASPLYRHEET